MKKIWLIGFLSPVLPNHSSKIKNKDVLKVFYYYNTSNSKKKSFDKVAEKILTKYKNVKTKLWSKSNVIKKIFKLVKDYERIKKKHNRKTAKQQESTDESYTKLINNIFDISVKKKIVHKVKAAKHPSQAHISDNQSKRKRTMVFNFKHTVLNNKNIYFLFYIHQVKNYYETCEGLSSESESEVDQRGDANYELSRHYSGKLKSSTDKSLAAKLINSNHLAATFDRVNISHRKAAMITSAIASVVENENEKSVAISTTYRYRKHHRQENAANIRDQFDKNNSPYFVVHWDSKIMPDTTCCSSGKKTDRLPVIVTGLNIEKLLVVEKLGSASGDQQSTAVFNAIENWHVNDKVAGTFYTKYRNI